MISYRSNVPSIQSPAICGADNYGGFMDRVTEQKQVSVFTFERIEINHLTLESEQWEYMEEIARNDLRKNGLESNGGDVAIDFGYNFRPTTLTIII